MQQTGLPYETGEQPAGAPFARSTVLEVLSNRRRRFAIHALKREQDVVDLGDLAGEIASWEEGKPIDQLEYQERKRVRNALRQFHLPKLDEEGFVDYDSSQGTVALTAAAERQDFHVDVLHDHWMPWGRVYVAASGVGVISALGAGLDVLPFSMLPSAMWFLCFAAVLLVASVTHHYDTAVRTRLGARETPPELGE